VLVQIITNGEKFGISEFTNHKECDLLYITDLYKELNIEEINQVKYKVFIGDDIPPEDIYFHHQIEVETFSLTQEAFDTLNIEAQEIIQNIIKESEVSLDIPDLENEKEEEEKEEEKEEKEEKDDEEEEKEEEEDEDEDEDEKFKLEIKEELDKLELFKKLMDLILKRLELGEPIPDITSLKLTLDNVLDIIANYGDFYVNMKKAELKFEKKSLQSIEYLQSVDKLTEKVKNLDKLSKDLFKSNKEKDIENKKLQNTLQEFGHKAEKAGDLLPTLGYINLNKLDTKYKHILYFKEYTDVSFFNTFIKFLMYHIKTNTVYDAKLVIFENSFNILRQQAYPSDVIRVDYVDNFKDVYGSSKKVLMTKPTLRRLNYIYTEGSAEEILIIIDRFYKGDDAISGASVLKTYVTNNENIIKLNNLNPLKLISNGVKDSYILENFNEKNIPNFKSGFNSILNEKLQYIAFYKEVIEGFLKRKNILGYSIEEE